jgi:uncharacterized protein YebE (UPF0316 family)/mono/diheme cytochrome c family protein
MPRVMMRIAVVVLSVFTLSQAVRAQDAPARKIAHTTAVALHEYFEGVDPTGRVLEADEHAEAVASLVAARTIADGLAGARGVALQRLLDTLVAAAREPASHSRVRALEGRLTALLGADAALTVPATSDVRRGATLYAERCASCHGDTGYGDGPAALALDPPPKALAGPASDRLDDALMFRIISAGVVGTSMAGFDNLPEDDRWAVVAYVQGLQSGGATAAPATGPTLPSGMEGVELLFAGVWGALFIFLARIVDVSCDTMRVLFTVRGKRTIAGVLGFTQALVWIFAVGTAIRHLDSWMHVVAYAGGYAAGTMIGITIERFVAYGVAQVRIITRSQGLVIATALRDLGFGVTQTRGEGRAGSVDILHSIVQRSQVDEVLMVIDQYDPAALVTVEEPRAVRGGFVDTREWRVPLPWEKSRQRV